MRSNLLFYLGVGIDGFALLTTLSNLFMMRDFSDGMTGAGRVVTIAIPLALLILIGLAFWFRHLGKMLLANILLWIPALPVAGGVVIWGGLAVLFVLFGK